MKFIFVDNAKVNSDIKTAVAYYNDINPKLAKQFLSRIREAKSRISQSPEAFQIKYNQVRTVLLNQFPYHIHYLIDSSKNRIVILAIIHSHQNPQDYTIR